jgi:hypothetical protein
VTAEKNYKHMKDTLEKNNYYQPLTWLDKVMEFFCFVALLCLWILTWYFHEMELRAAPQDFSFFKNPSYYWASNMTYTLPMIATAVYVLLTYRNRRPIPVEHIIQVNPEKQAKLLQINQRLMRWVKINIVFIFIIIEVLSYTTGSNGGTGIPYFVVFFLPVLMVGPVVYFLFEFSKNQLE